VNHVAAEGPSVFVSAIGGDERFASKIPSIGMAGSSRLHGFNARPRDSGMPARMAGPQVVALLHVDKKKT
jgi:hypothetical protein